jgi:hypothetical protein
LSRRTAFLCAGIIIITLSLLTGLKVAPGPDIVRMSLAFVSLFIIPGFLVSTLVFGSVDANIEGVCRGFLSGLTYICLVVCLGFIPGAGYPLIAVVNTCVVIIASIYLHFSMGVAGSGSRSLLAGMSRDKKALSRREKRVMALVLTVLFVLCAALFYGRGELGLSTDAPDHVSYIRRSLDSGAMLPGDSFHREGDGGAFDPRKGIWHPVVALWAWQSDVPVDLLWRMIPSFISFFAVLVFWLYAGELTGSVPMKIVSLLLLLIFFRGSGLVWLTKVMYSRHMVQIIVWGTVAYLIRYLRFSRTRDLWMIAMLAFTGTSVHLVYVIVAAVTMGGMLIYISVPGWGGSWRKNYWKSAAVVLAALLLPLTLRLMNAPAEVNMIHSHLQGMLLLGGNLRVIDPVELLMQLGKVVYFVIAMLPFYFILKSGGTEAKLVGVLSALPFFIVLNPLIATPLDRIMGYFHYRILFAAPYICFLSLGIRGLIAGRGMRWKGRVICLAVVAVFAVVFLRPAAIGASKDLLSLIGNGGGRHDFRGDNLARLLSDVPEHSVIASDPATSYMISASTDHFTVVALDQHCSPSDMEALGRVRNMRDLFNPSVPIGKPMRWLQEKGADYIVVDTHPGSRVDFFGVTSAQDPRGILVKLRSHRPLLTEIRSSDDMSLFRIDWNKYEAIDSTRTSGQGEISLEGFVLGSDHAMPGDTLRVEIVWGNTGAVPFGLPLEWTLRFDTDFPKGRFYREWYSKQYRRRVERRIGAFFRHTVSGRIHSAGIFPEDWRSGRDYLQKIMVPLPASMAPGEYAVKLSWRRAPLIPNRYPSDYLNNRDSYEGKIVAVIDIDGG